MGSSELLTTGKFSTGTLLELRALTGGAGVPPGRPLLPVSPPTLNTLPSYTQDT